MAARLSLADSQVRKNVRRATTVIQNKRAIVVNEQTDWQQLRESARQMREHTLKNLSHYLKTFETNFTKAGGNVHWARDAAEARSIIVKLARDAGVEPSAAADSSFAK